MNSDNLFDRLGSVLKDYIDDEDLQKQNRTQAARSKSGSEEEPNTSTDKKTFTYQGPKSRIEKNKSEQTARARGIVYKAPPMQLIEDFRVLGFTAFTDFQNCKKRYKRLLHSYHPDKYEADPKKQKSALDATVRLHKAFKNIEAWFNRNNGQQF
ncbi:J domain-containing protein [Treponema sp. OMZ 840]|uniref:J domain-containing protein n=1 Tax=Treponema sp. OMZ 840 TaxID=244313 RepID=UPI003D93164B